MTDHIPSLLLGWSILILHLIACRGTTPPIAITPIPTATAIVLRPVTTAATPTATRPAAATVVGLPPPLASPTPSPQATPPPGALTPAASFVLSPTLSQPLTSTRPLTDLPMGIESLLPMNDPTGKLSFRLAILANPDIYHLAPPLQSQRVGLPDRGPGSLIRNQQDDLLVYIRLADVPGTGSNDLKAVGATITHEAGGYGIITAFIAPARLNDLARLEGVQSVQEVLSP